MNVKDYISSGVLEAYVLGDLSEPERMEVERNLATYPELRAELAAIEQVHEQLMLKAGVQPAASVKEKIFPKVGAAPGRQVAFQVWRLAVAASVTLAIISTVAAIYYRDLWQEAESSLIALNNERRQMADTYNSVNQKLDKMEDEIAIISNPQFTRVIMTGTKVSPESMASVYWNQSSEEVYVRIHNLKALAREQQYQLWAIIDGKPVDAGVFDADQPGLLKMKTISPGATLFAVTIEPRGGKPAPTLETMQVAGPVAKS